MGSSTGCSKTLKARSMALTERISAIGDDQIFAVYVDYVIWEYPLSVVTTGALALVLHIVKSMYMHV